jgi:hypothetical protein
LSGRLVSVTRRHAHRNLALWEHGVSRNPDEKPDQLALVRYLARRCTGTTTGHQFGVLHNRSVEREGHRLTVDLARGGRQEKRDWHPGSEDGTGGRDKIRRNGPCSHQEHAGVSVLRGTDEHRNRIACERSGNVDLARIRRWRDVVAQHLHLSIPRREAVQSQQGFLRRVPNATVNTISVRDPDLDRPHHRWDAQAVLPLGVERDRSRLDRTTGTATAPGDQHHHAECGNEMPPRTLRNEAHSQTRLEENERPYKRSYPSTSRQESGNRG